MYNEIFKFRDIIRNNDSRTEEGKNKISYFTKNFRNRYGVEFMDMLTHLKNIIEEEQDEEKLRIYYNSHPDLCKGDDCTPRFLFKYKDMIIRI